MIINVNGAEREVTLHGSESLLFALRDRLALPGSKSACEQGECGSCSILMDGELVCSCLVMAADAEGSEIVTIEGIVQDDRLNSVQEALLAAAAVQCGFCTPGIVVAATDLLNRNPTPTTNEIREALAGNICRCTGYGSIVRGLADVAGLNR